jgi:hypothetical protein
MVTKKANAESAEVKRLRAENERLRAEVEEWKRTADDWVKEANFYRAGWHEAARPRRRGEKRTAPTTTVDQWLAHFADAFLSERPKLPAKRPSIREAVKRAARLVLTHDELGRPLDGKGGRAIAPSGAVLESLVQSRLPGYLRTYRRHRAGRK